MKRVLVILTVLLVVGAVLALVSMNSLVAAAIERAGSAALGVETEVDDVDVGLIGAEARLHGLTIANPEGFGETDFLALESAVFDLAAPTLLEDVIRIPLLEFEGTTLRLVQRGSASNIATFLAQLEGDGGETPSGDETPEDGSGGKRFLVERIVLRQVAVDVELDLLGDGTKSTTASLVIPEVLVQDVGNAETGAPLEDVVEEVVKALLSATLSADGGSILDGTLRKQLEEGLDGLETRGREAVEGAIEGAKDKVEGVLDDVNESLDGVLDDATEGLGEKAGDLLKGIGGRKDG